MIKLMTKILKKLGLPDDMVPVVFIIIFLFSLLSLVMGIEDANAPNECRVNSIFDVIKSPVYVIGCNLGKDRFDLKVN